MQKIRETLEGLCESFKLGSLLSWEEKQTTLNNYRLVVFNTETETNLKYWFKIS